MASSIASAKCSKRRTSISSPTLSVEWLGTVPYARALEIQHAAVEARREGDTGDRLLLLEHPPVVTLGRGTRPENLLCTPEELEARGIELVSVARGGDVTLHAPGQLVGYLIKDLKAWGEPDVHRFLRGIETALIEALASLNLVCRRIPGKTGVFMAGSSGPDRKIASIGVGVRHWVTLHGFAINVSVDLQAFDVIVPCGLQGVLMTSVAKELALGDPAAPVVSGLDLRVRERVGEAFVETFD